jgi:uncharacterized protein (DUF433 family)
MVDKGLLQGRGYSEKNIPQGARDRRHRRNRKGKTIPLINADQEIKISPRRRGGAEKINADIMATVFKDIKMQFSRITINPRQMGGVPCIRGLRIPVATILDMVAEGMEAPEILKAYPDLEAEDIREALHFAAEAVRERELPLHIAELGNPYR